MSENNIPQLTLEPQTAVEAVPELTLGPSAPAAPAEPAKPERPYRHVADNAPFPLACIITPSRQSL